MASLEGKSAAVTCTAASNVGKAFIFRYYNVLYRCPELGYQFYQDISKLCRLEENGHMSVTTTMEAIKEKIRSMGYSEPDCKTEVISVDSQDCYYGGIIVAVTGYMTLKGKLRRMFSQIFFLAPQDKGYFVLTDVLRYINDDGPQKVTDVFQASSNFENDDPSEDETFKQTIDVNGEVYNPPKSDQTILVETPGMDVVEVHDKSHTVFVSSLLPSLAINVLRKEVVNIPDKSEAMSESSLTSSSSLDQMVEVSGTEVVEVPDKSQAMTESSLTSSSCLEVVEGSGTEVVDVPDKSQAMSESSLTSSSSLEMVEGSGTEVVDVPDKSQAISESSLTSSSSLEMVEVSGTEVVDVPDKSQAMSESSLTSSSSLEMVEVPGVEIVEVPEKSQISSESSSSSEEVPKKTYAAILKSNVSRSYASGSSAVRSAPRTQSHLVVSASASPSVNVSKTLASYSKATGNVTQLKTEGNGYSIYLKGLPMATTHSLIENEFKKFGSIKRNSVRIRTQKGICFGFLEFEVSSAMQRAIEASPVLINGHRVAVKEKRSMNRVSRQSQRAISIS